jgi:DNA repair and recombination protein RAD54B
VVFCAPTVLQRRVYKALLENQALWNCLYNGDFKAHLKAITVMRKICNAINLIKFKIHSVPPSKFELIKNPDDALYSSLKDVLPTGGIPSTQDSGKLSVLTNFLVELHRMTAEKVVIVSNFTKTLDLLQAVLQRNNMTWCRLDGDTESSKRQHIVDKFNSCDSKTCCTCPPNGISLLTLGVVAFLLSSKSGGCGLNLVGASRLILYDVDWNPSNDLQAMARIHRDGQKRSVYIYRFLTYPPMLTAW